MPQDAVVVLRRGELRRGLGEPHLSLTPAGPRRLSQGSLDELRPERSGAEGERRKAKVPPPVPKKPSVLYLPLIPAPAQLGAGVGDLPPTPSPIITLDTDPTCCDPDAEDPPSPKAVGTTPASEPASEQGEGLPTPVVGSPQGQGFPMLHRAFTAVSSCPQAAQQRPARRRRALPATRRPSPSWRRMMRCSQRPAPQRISSQ